MGHSSLCLLLLLSSYTLAQERSGDNEQTCLLMSRFKTNKKYVYQYITESRNSVVSTAILRNGPRVSCQVEIEVPQMCRFVLHTRGCALSEASVMDRQGQPVYWHTPSSEAFQAAMETNPLKFSVDEVTSVQLYPETDEPVNILNIKRGIISALLLPVMEEEYNKFMSTVHGQCLTTYLVHARTDITDVTLSRDLSQCNGFYSREQVNSPLALLQKLHRPISKLITSTQDCSYHFDNKGKHIMAATCTEKHIYSTFSHENNGISSVVTQELSFQNVKRINNKEFVVKASQSKPLHFEDPDNKAPVQMNNAVLSTLQDIVALAGTDQGQKRTSLFHKLVSSLRVLRNETLSQTVPEMMDVSGWLTWQALFQCGTKECISAILQAIRTIDGLSLEVDALVYGLSLQADPDASRVRDMLSMAQYKQSRAIMYALANTVKKFNKEEVTPVVKDVSEFMEILLNDCSGEIIDEDSDVPADPKEMAFLVLRVVGVMGQAMQAVSPSLISSILRCAKKTDIPLSNQKAAIQAFRLMDMNDEVRSILMEVYQDAQSPVEKRVASYLILMKSPDQALVTDILNNLENVESEQLKSFVVSHLKNIWSSGKPEMHQFREYIESALRDQLHTTNKIFDGMSSNYRIDSPLGSVQSNIIFDVMDTLPKEVMLETTLKVFNYNYDIFEAGVEGTGFEPTIDALFGENGFFPDSISKVMYWAGDKAKMLKGVLDRITPEKDRVKRQLPVDLLKDIRNSVQKLMDDMRFSPAPEAIAYLRLLGAEIGYMKTSDMRKMAETLSMYYHVFIRVLPVKAFFALTSSTENEVFAHYIFMENAFSLPTAAGFPLRFSLAGVFAPGAKGGLTHSPASTLADLSFMPSVGLEFITQMGVHIPDYVAAGLEMHTNMYHESSLNAKVTMSRNQLRLSIPAPKSNTQLFSISNKLLSVSSGQTEIVQSNVEDRIDSTDCQPLFTGLKLCTIARYSNATSVDHTPYYPLTGESRFAVEIESTGAVSEYTATITDEILREGKKGRNKVDSLKLILKAEGDDSSEVSASLKYNRNKNTVSTEVIIPDFDVEAGIKLAVTDSDAKGKKMRGITLDVTNRNIPQLSLVGRTRLDMMKDAMLQLQIIVPFLKTDASVTATLKRDEDVLMDLETVIHLPETYYQQKASFKYDDDKFEVELKSDLNSEIQQLIPNVEDHHRQLQQLIDHILDQKVAKTDMKLRHIVTKGIEAGDIWLDKLTARIPYLAKIQSKRSISDLTLPVLPEKLFLQSDILFRYQFNKDKMAISLPLPHGGKKSEDLNIPTTLSVPLIDIAEIGLYIPAKNYPLPSFTIPPSLDFTVPLFGLAEASTKISSNFYSWEGSISGGNNTVNVPSYIAQYRAMAQSPFNLLSYKLEGTGMMSGIADHNLKYLLNSSFSHSLIDTSFSVLETLTVTNKLNARANYKFKASSPVGLQASLYYSAQSTSTLDSDQVSGDGTMDGSLNIGSFTTNTSYTHSYNLHPLDGKVTGESTLHFNSPLIEVHNAITGVYANSELNIVSKTNTQKDVLKHVAELKYKDAQLTLKCSAAASAMGQSLNNKVELGVSKHMAILRIESQADDETNRAYSHITGSLDSNRLEVNSEGSLSFNSGHGLHKASVTFGRNGLTMSGTNSIECSPVTVENIFNGAIYSNRASLSSRTKVIAEESRGELNIEGKITATEASLNGILRGHAYDATTRNNMDVVLNHRALTFTSNNMGRLNQMETENSHTLTVTLWTLALHSKTNSFTCEDVYYKQDTKVDMKPFVFSLDMTNELKFYDVSLNNEGHMKLEPVKMGLIGSIKGAYGEEHNINHSYELSYDDMAGTMKYSTSGNVMDAQLSHNCELDLAGLSAKSNCEARINSEPLHFDSTIRTMALPFSLTVDALFNSNGEIILYGKHTGQLYSKLLVKAEPLALVYSHDSRVSTTHMLPSGESSTNLDNKFNGLLTPSDQSLTWKVKSKVNNHVYNQDVSTYNNPQKIGVEFSGVMVPHIFRKDKGSEIQEFSMAGFLKYDKSSDCHVIDIAFIESFPVAFTQFKNTLVQALESLQQVISRLDINQLITDFTGKLDQLPMQVSDFMRDIDLENNANQVKAKLDYLINEFAVTMDDIEVTMINLRQNMQNAVMDIVTKTRDILSAVKDYVKARHYADKMTMVLLHIESQLRAFEEKYDIKQSLVQALDMIEDVIRQIDLQKLTETSTTWLRNLDLKYGILEKIKDKLSQLKQAVRNFDLTLFFQDISDYLLSVDLAMYVEQLSYKIPSAEISRVMESMNDVIVNWIDEYEIPNKINMLYSHIRDILLKYNLDDEFKELMDQAVILIKEFKIVETVQLMVDALNSIKFEMVYDTIMQRLHSVTSTIGEIDLRKSIDDLNENISSVLKSMKEFDYNAFLDETNNKIAELTNYINEQIKTYEIVQKIEAVRTFFREIQSSILTYLQELKNTKVSDALKRLTNVIDTAFYNDIKLKVQDILEDVHQRILDMDIRNEIYIYQQRASESYSNVISYIYAQFNQLMENILKVTNDNEIVTQMKHTVNGILDALKKTEIKVPTFTVPLTDLIIPAFTINLDKLQDISIPARLSVPEFTILNSYTIPSITIDFDNIKAKIVASLDNIREFEIQIPDPEEIFGDLKVLYLSELPDLTFPEITLSEIRFPTINIPKLNLKDFEITMLPIPDIQLPELPINICIPMFGKLHGDLRVNSPRYTLRTIWKIENSTSTTKTPQFTAIITSHAKSPIKPLEYTFEATAQLEAPRMKKLLFTETVEASHVAFSIDQKGSLTLTGSSAEALAKTTTKATTQMYMADLVNNALITLKDGISAAVDTTYNHNLDIPLIEMSSQASMKQNISASLETGSITVTSETTCDGKWSIQDYSDEGTHKSNVEFNVNFSTAKLTVMGETGSKALKSKQTLTAESVFLNHVTVEARCETEAPSVKKSLMALKGEAHVGDLKVAVTASHDAEFTGSLTGFMANSLEFMAIPFEIVLDVKNEVTSKIKFPLKLTGKVDLQNDYGVILNSEKQRACWFTLARFNQYKYNQNFITENNGIDMFLHSSIIGEANLDFLTVPLSIPEITVPYFEIKTPEIRDLSLWDNAGLETLLTNTQQTFDLNLKLHYYKNPDKHSFELHLEPIYHAIIDNTNILQAQFEQCRDRIVAVLKDSYNQAKAQYIKHKIDTSSLPPRIFSVPGYKIPLLNIEVSAFRAEMPAFSYFVPKEISTPSFKVPAQGFSAPSYTLVLPSLELPVVHVPEMLSEIKLPTFTLPAIQNNIFIPALGNITCDFSFKSTVISINANAGLCNQSDIVASFGASSTSVFDILNGRIDGTTSLTMNRGIKVASTVSLEHKNVESNHQCAVSLTRRRIEASVANTAKINLPILNLEFYQKLTGSTKTQPSVSFEEIIKYKFNIPLVEAVSKGNLIMDWALETRSSYVHLQTYTQGESDITIMNRGTFAGNGANEATFRLNVDQLRSSVKTSLALNIDKQEKVKRSSKDNFFHFDFDKELALEMSLQQTFATIDYTSNNNIELEYFNTNGKHIFRGELDFVPLKSFKTILNIDASQPSNYGHAGLIQSINVDISSEKQLFIWSGKEQLASLIHASDLLMCNDNSESRIDLTRSVEGHLAFLKAVKLPVYQKTLWDILKYDQVINMGDLQFINISSSIVYTKSMDIQQYTIPYKIFEDYISKYLKTTSVFIPYFGAITATLKVSSPIYNVSTTANMEKSDPGLVTSLTSICTSTMIFLEYKLHANATIGFDGGINLNGKCNFIHSDVNVDWQHVLEQNLRLKRQTSLADSMESLHTLNVDITSQTFVEASFRFASRKDGITASVSCPSSGFLGLQIQRRSPSQLYGKLFSRYLSTPEKDTDVFTAKAMLRNSQKFILQMSWNWDFLHDVIEGTKDSIPAFTDAVLKFINEYHIAHFGFDLNRGGMKLKNTVSNGIERAYYEVPMSFNRLQNSITHLSDEGEDMYRRASDTMMLMSVQDVMDWLADEVSGVLKHSENKIFVLLDAITRFLSDTKITLPGSEEKLSSLEMLQRALRSVSRATNRAVQRFASILEVISSYVRQIEFTIPGTDVVLNGNYIIDKLLSGYDQLRYSVHRGFNLFRETLNNLPWVTAEKAQILIAYLKDEHVDIASQIDHFYAEVELSTKQNIEEAKRYVSEYKDHAKQKIQEAYNALSREQVNNGTKEFISIFQSHLYGGLNECVDLMRQASQSTAPYIRVSNKKMDIEIPLPFLWKSFSEWPTQSTQ